MIYRRGATTTDANRQGRLQNRSNLKETELFFFFKSFVKVEFTFNEIHVSNQ